MNKKNIDKNEYPDISGIFDIDESSLPKELMAKEKHKKNRHQQSILISEDSEKRMAKEREKELKATQKKQKAKAQKRARLKKKAILVLVLAVIIILAVFSIKGIISEKTAPQVTLSDLSTGDISVSYMSDAVMLLSEQGSLYAAFVDNDFDLHSLSKGLEAIISSSDSRTFTAQLSLIANAEVNSELTAQIQSALPDATYSSASNYIIYITPTQSITGINEKDTVKVEIIIESASKALLMPVGALYSDENGEYVWKYSSFSDKIKKTYVSTGVNNGQFVQIVDGLKNKDSVVAAITDEGITLKNNQKVKTTEQ